MHKRIIAIATAALISGILISGCEYDPSMMDSTGFRIEDYEEEITATVIENTVIRSGPGADYDEVDRLSVGDRVTLTGNLENGYYPVLFKEFAYGYVDETCLEINLPVVTEPQVVNTITATVIDNINIRRGPGQDYELIERIGPGVELTIIGEEENGYYPVDYNGEIGYAHHNFIEINEQPVEVQYDDGEVIDGPITIDNNEAFATIVSLTDPFDDRIEQFANSHIGDIIEFDGYMGDVAHHGTYNTRYDFLVCFGDWNDPSVGPNFHFTNYSYSDMHFDDNTPDSVYANDEFRFTAEIVSYNDMTGLFELRPVSTVYRGS